MKQLYSVLLMIRREKLYLEKRLVSEGYDVFESEDQMRADITSQPYMRTYLYAGTT